jgi:hypothetical protein
MGLDLLGFLILIENLISEVISGFGTNITGYVYKDDKN